MRGEAILLAVERRGWALVAAAALFALGLSGVDMAAGVALGGALGLLNFRLIKLYFSRVLRRGRRPAGWMHAAYMAKYGVLALLLVAAFRFWGPHPLGVIGGFSVSVVALIWAGLTAPKGADKSERAVESRSVTSHWVRNTGTRA